MILHNPTTRFLLLIYSSYLIISWHSNVLKQLITGCKLVEECQKKCFYMVITLNFKHIC